jgi:excisionase family DNA binding protein
MTGRSGRGGWGRVVEARQRARKALGQDPTKIHLFDSPPKKKLTAYVPLSRQPAEPRRDESIGVLTLGEAAVRLGLSREDLDRMIGGGLIKALPTGYTRTIPTREVERLQKRSH